jgi:hypothetical protein
VDKTVYVQPKTIKFEFMGPHGVVLILVGLPLAVAGLNLFCDEKGCPPTSIWKTEQILEKVYAAEYWNWNAFAIYVGWLALHLVLSIVAPGEIVQGTELPNGKRLPYKLNAFSSMVTSFSLLGYLVWMKGLAPLVWMADHYFQLATAGIVFCGVLSVLLYLYSLRSTDVIVAAGGNSGYPLYDLWMGRELNPRLFYGKIDLKFVCELRPGLIGWSIFNIAFAAKQYQSFGQISNSIVLVMLGQGYYVFDAIWNEKAILTTMDIISDGFG